MPLENLGSFLEGAFAPLAFLWLVIGMFIQQKELADNTEVLRQSTLQSEKQTQAIAATELNARQETFFKIADNVKRQLGVTAGMLYISSQAVSQGGTVPDDDVHVLWSQLSNGDYEVFQRAFLMVTNSAPHDELFYGTEIRARHSRNFQSTFERLLRLAENCDVDGIIVDSLTQTGHGMMYNALRNADPDGAEQPVVFDAQKYANPLNRMSQ